MTAGTLGNNLKTNLFAKEVHLSFYKDSIKWKARESNVKHFVLVAKGSQDLDWKHSTKFANGAKGML